MYNLVPCNECENATTHTKQPKTNVETMQNKYKKHKQMMSATS